ncbi:MAG: hypothetical protein QM723_11460 [Myxococcaceae bacterium]
MKQLTIIGATAAALLGFAASGALSDPFPVHPQAPKAKKYCQKSPMLTRFDPELDFNQPPPTPDEQEETGMQAQLAQLDHVDGVFRRASELRPCAALVHGSAVPYARLMIGTDGAVTSATLDQGGIEALLCVQRITREWSFTPSPSRFVLRLPVEDCDRR